MDISQALNLRNTIQQNSSQESYRVASSIKNNNSQNINEYNDVFKRQQLEQVAQDFEKIFVNMLFSSMRETLNKKDDLLYGGFSQDIFEDMLYEKYSEEVASTNFLGFGQMIVSEYEKFV